MTPEMKAAFLAIAENAVAQCLIPVPSVPLMELGEAVARIFDVLEADSRTMDADERLMEVWIAAHNVGWTFWPNNEFGSRQALVNSESLRQLADALAAYRQAADRAASDDIPLSVPHWESGTPIIGIMP